MFYIIIEISYLLLDFCKIVIDIISGIIYVGGKNIVLKLNLIF